MGCLSSQDENEEDLADQVTASDQVTGSDELVHVEIFHRHGDRTPIYLLTEQETEESIWVPMIADAYKWLQYDESSKSVVRVPKFEDSENVFSWQFINDLMLKYTKIVSTTDEDDDDSNIFTTNVRSKFEWQGLLTNTGVAQLRATGQYLRDRYIETLQFLPQTSDDFDDNIYYQSTNDTRNFYSAESLLSTLYPDVTSSDKRINIYVSAKRDWVFAPFDTKDNRPGWKELLKENESFATNDLLHPQIQEITTDVLAKFACEFEESSPIFLIQDAYTCRVDHVDDDNEIIINEKKEDVIDVELGGKLGYEVFKQQLYGMTGGDCKKNGTSLRYAIGDLLYELYSNLADAAQNDDGPKCRIYSCHDETLSPLLCALNIQMDNMIDLAGVYDWPPYGVAMCFELWQRNDENQTKYIKIRYNEKEIEIGGQTEMDLEELSQFWKDIFIK
eukprot:193716_1